MKYFLIVIIGFLSCTGKSGQKQNTRIDSEQLPLPPKTPEINWLDQNKVTVDFKNLTHKGEGFRSDSILAIDYEGYDSNRGYAPLNDKGQWISTIKKITKLTPRQVDIFHEIQGRSSSFENPMFVACYEPRLGLVYFKNSKVIAQSAICLSCGRLESSAELGNGEFYTEFNEATLAKLEGMCKELNFSNCK